MTNYIGNKPSDIPLTENDIPNLPTSKITSGTFANSLISASSVTQHAQSVDLQPVKSDITALALREATNESSASFNLPNQHIDTFATDTLGTKTQVSVASGYVGTVTSSIAGSFTDLTSTATAQALYGTGNQAGTFPDFVRVDNGGGSGNWFLGNLQTKTATPLYAFVIDLGGSYSLRGSEINFRSWSTVARINEHYYIFKNLSGTWEYLNGTAKDSASGTSSSTSNMTASNGDNIHGINVSTSGADADYLATQIGIVPQTIHNNGNTYAGISYVELNGKAYTLTATATGTAIQNTNTVGSSKSEVGGTFLYKNNSGTATLGTDLKVYFSCNGGTQWTEASSYNAITPVYSTGILQVRLGKTTCTAGTNVLYKVEWANQSSGSKETQLHGIGINY